MSNQFYDKTIALLLALCLLLALLACAGWLGLHQLTDDAIKNGAAEYYLDAENNRRLRWKECGE